MGDAADDMTGEAGVDRGRGKVGGAECDGGEGCGKRRASGANDGTGDGGGKRRVEDGGEVDGEEGTCSGGPMRTGEVGTGTASGERCCCPNSCNGG